MPFYVAWFNFSGGSDSFECSCEGWTSGFSFRIAQVLSPFAVTTKDLCNCGCVSQREVKNGPVNEVYCEFHSIRRNDVLVKEFHGFRDAFYESVHAALADLFTQTRNDGRNAVCYSKKPVDLNIIEQQIFDKFRAKAKDRGFTWTADAQEPTCKSSFMPVQFGDDKAHELNLWMAELEPFLIPGREEPPNAKDYVSWQQQHEKDYIEWVASGKPINPLVMLKSGRWVMEDAVGPPPTYYSAQSRTPTEDGDMVFHIHVPPELKGRRINLICSVDDPDPVPS